LRKHYEQQLKNSTEILQKNNTELQNRLNESTDIASQKGKENEALKKKLRECERQLQEKINSSPKYFRDADGYSYEEQMVKTKHALEEKRRELDRFKERHAAFSERRVRSDQRRTENTLSTNRQSQLESDYVIEFKDGTRVDAIDIITTRVGRYRGSKISSIEYLRCCRLACFVFEIAYEVVLAVKESFAAFTCTVMEMLVEDAPAIGSDNNAFNSKSWKLQYGRPKETLHTTTQDALSEVMILVKERAKKHDLHSLVQRVISSVATQWNSRYRDQLLLDYDSILLHGLNDYIKYCTQFAWCAVTQVPPLKIDYKTAAYSSRSHTVSQAFSSTEERSPTRRSIRSESRTVLCYLWPTLQDCDGKVIRKGEVILNH